MQQRAIRNKKVLLVAKSSLISVETLLHSINLSKRMNASLEVLHLLYQVPADRAAQSFKENVASLQTEEPIAYIPVEDDRGISIETVDYARNRRNIICVALCLKGGGTQSTKGIDQEKLNEVSQLLDCPVLLYTDNPANECK